MTVVIWVTMVVALVLIVWLGWTGHETRSELRSAAQKAVRVAELRGTITNLNDLMLMSAQMAAATGERRWTDRFEEVVPKLDTAVADAAELAPVASRASLASTTGEAHRDLVTMERRALALAASGDLTAARTLLNGPEVAYLEDVYATGIDVFGQTLTTLADTRAADLNDRAWMEAAGLGLSAVFLVAIALSMRSHKRLRGAQDRTAAVARTDALTELPNRRQFYEQLEAALRDSHQSLSHALLLVDLDRFKAANDAFGHPAGDQVLRLVAGRLQSGLRGGDLVARLGGDEFAVVVRSDNRGRDLRDGGEPAAVASRIVSALGAPFVLDGGAVVQIGASIGVAFVRGRDRVQDLIQRADVALYRAKADGRGCFRLFEEGMDADMRTRALLEGELRHAIAEDAIVPHFQPLVSLDTGRLIGVEMLARWPHPSRGMVPPGEFIPIAEELGLIGPLTERLMVRACRTAAKWPDHVMLACNVSPVQLRDPDLPVMIRRVLDKTGFAASRLEIEVTESALVGDLDFARTLLDQLKALGLRLALDDFGTGYSSLRHLQMLPFDKIKIDRSFVSAMRDDKESGKIVSSVLNLGQSLGLATVAEGVETADVAALLRELGCDVGQGWLFGRPAPAEALEGLIFASCRQAAPSQAA